MSAVAIVEVNLATVCIQSALYGVFFVLAVTALVVLASRHHQESSNLRSGSRTRLPQLDIWRSPLFSATVILLLTVTANWCLIVYRAFQAFIHFENGTNAIGFYAQVSPTSLALNIMPTVTVITCDFMVIYRTWVIWNRKLLVVVLPTCTTLGLLVCSIMIDVIIGTTGSEQTDALTPWLDAAYTFTLCNNFYGTGMITYRIISANQRLRSVARINGGMRVQRTLGILVESAALYAAWTLFFFISYVTKAPINELANDCFPAVSGIALMLITVRVGLGWAHRSDSSMGSHGVSASSSYIRSGISRPERQPDGLPLHAISLNVSTTVERETDFGLRGQTGDDKSPTSSLKDDHTFRAV